MVEAVTGNNRVEYTPSKQYENERRAENSYQEDTTQV